MSFLASAAKAVASGVGNFFGDLTGTKQETEAIEQQTNAIRAQGAADAPIAPPPPPMPPSLANSGVASTEAATRAAAASAAGAGFAGSILSGSQGAPAPSTASKQLYGQ